MGVTAKHLQRMPTTMQEVVPEPELIDIGLGPLGVSAMQQEKLLDKSGDDP
jgi:hypothetical protein